MSLYKRVLMNVTLGYTILYVPDIKKTVAFYQNAFGIEVDYIGKDEVFVQMATGTTKLSFLDAGFAQKVGIPFKMVSPDEPAPGIEIALTTTEVQKAYDAALAHGATSVQEPSQKPWGQVTSIVRDINGLLLEISSPINK